MAYSNDDVVEILEDMPHGGGEYYTEDEGKLDPDEADVTVTTPSELESEAGPNQVIEIGADMDLTGYEIDIGNSTLVGDRGWDGSDGPLLTTDTHSPTSGGAMDGRPYAALYSMGSDTPRVTGIRMEGYYSGTTSLLSGSGDEYLQRAIWLNGDEGEVDNCELYGFPWAAIMVGGIWPSHGDCFNVHIHHCHIHTTLRSGYGYGVNFARGSGELDHIYFDNNRHSINGQGRYFCSYTAEECIFGPNQQGHMVDQHSLTESGHSSSTDPDDPDFGLRSGGATEARDCTFLHGSNAVGTARGVPWEYFRITDCWIAHDSIPSSNVGNSRTGAWYQQNIHGSTGGDGESYAPLADDGEFTDEWSTSGNELGAADPSVSWSSDVGASVDLENPENSPAYQGYSDDPPDPEEEYDLTVSVLDEGGSSVEHAVIEVNGEEGEAGSGGYTFSGLTAGEYDIDVTAYGFIDEDSTSVEITDSDLSETVTLEDDPDEWFGITDSDGIIDFGDEEYDADFSYEAWADDHNDTDGSMTNDSDDAHAIVLSPEQFDDDRIYVRTETVDGDSISGVLVTLYEDE